jgi:dTDP-4-dehydrorhamnose 3,5-epimerase
MGHLKIHGLELTILKQIIDQRGAVYHYLKADDENFKGFGEAYYSRVNAGVIKGWKYHYEIHQQFCVPLGAIEIVVYDDRRDSKSYGHVDTILLDDKQNYARLSMPPKLWYSFKCVSKEYSLLANIINQGHRADESKTLPLDTKLIPYEWQ